MRVRTREVLVPVVLEVPAVGVMLWGLLIVATMAAVLAIVVSTSHFSDGSATVPTTLGPCEPFCAARSAVAPTPQGGE